MKKILSLLVIGLGFSCWAMELPLEDMVKEILTNPNHRWKAPKLPADLSRMLGAYSLRHHPVAEYLRASRPSRVLQRPISWYNRPMMKKFARAVMETTSKLRKEGFLSACAAAMNFMGEHVPSIKVTAVQFNKKGDTLVTVSDDNSVEIWNVETAEWLMKFKGDSDTVLSAQFNDEGTTVVTTSKRGTILTWDVATGQCLATVQGQPDGGAAAETTFAQSGDREATILDGIARISWADSWKDRFFNTLTLEQALLLIALHEINELRLAAFYGKATQNKEKLAPESIVFDFSQFPPHVKEIFDTFPEPVKQLFKEEVLEKKSIFSEFLKKRIAKKFGFKVPQKDSKTPKAQISQEEEKEEQLDQTIKRSRDLAIGLFFYAGAVAFGCWQGKKGDGFSFHWKNKWCYQLLRYRYKEDTMVGIQGFLCLTKNTLGV